MINLRVYLTCVDRVLTDNFFCQWLSYTFLNKNCPGYLVYEVESAGVSFEFHVCFAMLRLWSVCSEWCGVEVSVLIPADFGIVGRY